MKYSHFLQILLAYKKFSEDISSLYGMGFDLMEGKYNITDPVYLMLKESIESHYGNDGWEWTSWFIYESKYGQKDFSTVPTYAKQEDGTYKVTDGSKFGAYDEAGNPICYSYESLWEYLEKKHKISYKIIIKERNNMEANKKTSNKGKKNESTVVTNKVTMPAVTKKSFLEIITFGLYKPRK